MNDLPNADLAIISPRKITHYLLSPTHHAGGTKAAYFHKCGFDLANWEALQAALLNHACSNKVLSVEITSFGVKYVIIGPLITPNGRNPVIQSVWFIEDGTVYPRLVTAYPGKRGLL